MIRILILLISIVTFNSCTTQKSVGTRELTEIIPPNIVFLKDSLGVDRTEVSNIAYKEFLYHMRQYNSSKELYPSLLPDSSWYTLSYNGLDTIEAIEYFRDVRFDDYPVVGINRKQATEYARWRSDAVFFTLLIEIGFVKPDPNRRYTVEDFINDPRAIDMPHVYYPQYYIPAEEDWEAIKKMIDEGDLSINKTASIEKANLYGMINNIPWDHSSYKGSENKDVLRHILGNVSELVDHAETTFGGSYQDKAKDMRSHYYFKKTVPSPEVGFRCFFKWVKIDVAKKLNSSIDIKKLPTQ